MGLTTPSSSRKCLRVSSNEALTDRFQGRTLGRESASAINRKNDHSSSRRSGLGWQRLDRSATDDHALKNRKEPTQICWYIIQGPSRIECVQNKKTMIRAASTITKRRLVRQVVTCRPSFWIDSADDGSKNDSVIYASSSPVLLPTAIPLFASSRRQFSSDSGAPDSGTSTTDNVDVSVDETLNKLFQDSQQQIVDAASTGDAWYAAAGQVAWEPTWYNLADQAVVALAAFRDFTGLEFGWSIIGVTLILRLGLFPVMVTAQQTTSRMAHLQPELTMMKNRYEALGTPSRQDQMQFTKNMKALFAKYKVKPMRAFAGPLIQLPLFMGFFFGLKKMPDIYATELSTEGMFWFPDLTATDPLYILPIASAASFLLLIEMGKDQMMAQNPAQGKIMLNVFRALSISMLPVCINFDTAMLCYWTSNNILTIGQTALLKQSNARKYFGIWEPPKPVPGQEPEGLKEVMTNLAKRVRGEATSDKQRMHSNNVAVEAKNKAAQVMRKKPHGITGTRNR
jgi:YidC/Oxa1 family membrane protein insertase